MVVCGDRILEAEATIKSALMFAGNNVRMSIHAVCDEENSVKLLAANHLNLKVYPLHFPEKQESTWKKLFKECASQRLFLPSVLTDISRVIYIDTDTMFLDDPAELWRYFEGFNSVQNAALAVESEGVGGWYGRFAQHPVIDPRGLNSGVMLMDLDHMREQHILNIYYHDHPERLNPNLTCAWNFRPDNCQYGIDCKPAQEHGVSLMHGNRRVFHNIKGDADVRDINIQPAFQILYDLIVSADTTQPRHRMIQSIINVYESRTREYPVSGAYIMCPNLSKTSSGPNAVFVRFRCFHSKASFIARRLTLSAATETRREALDGK